MHSSSLVLKSLLAKHTFYAKESNNVLGVYPDLAHENAIKANAIKLINDAATEFYNAYESFYNTARKELGDEFAL